MQLTYSKNNLGHKFITGFVLISSLRAAACTQLAIKHDPLEVYLGFVIWHSNIESEILDLISNGKIIDQVALAGPRRILL